MDIFGLMLDNLSKYVGTGLLWMLLLVGILYLAFRMKKSPDKSFLVWFPIIVLAIYFFPAWNLFAMLRSDAEILYRLLWLIPFGAVVCYTMVEVISTLKGKTKGVAFVFSVILIMLCGNYVYDNPAFSKAENVYHVPQVIVDICKEIEVPGREIKACFPDELVECVRQYTPYTLLSYGRDSLLTGDFQKKEEIKALLNNQVVDAGRLSEVLRDTETHYLIIGSDRKINGSFAEYDFYYVTTIDKYDIYLDNRAYLGLWND